MSCLHPLRIKNPRYNKVPPSMWRDFSPILTNGLLPDDYYITVPCGHCILCEKNKSRDWVNRMLFEFDLTKQGIFITLTFNDDSYQKFFNRWNKAISLFLDRWRKEFAPLRYIFIPDIGEDFGRLHYHGILFGTQFLPISDVTRVWQYGYCWLGYCNVKTIRYVAKYITKPTKEKLQELQISKLPRIMVSKGLGASYINSKTERIHKNKHGLNPFISSGSGSYLLPRYIYNKIFDRNERDFIIKKLKERPREFCLDGVKFNNERDYSFALKEKYDLYDRLKLINKKSNKSILHYDANLYSPELQSDSTQICEKP